MTELNGTIQPDEAVATSEPSAQEDKPLRRQFGHEQRRGHGCFALATFLAVFINQ